MCVRVSEERVCVHVCEREIHVNDNSQCIGQTRINRPSTMGQTCHVRITIGNIISPIPCVDVHMYTEVQSKIHARIYS